MKLLHSGWKDNIYSLPTWLKNNQYQPSWIGETAIHRQLRELSTRGKSSNPALHKIFQSRPKQYFNKQIIMKKYLLIGKYLLT